MLVCGRPGDRDGTETPTASVPRHKVQARHARGYPQPPEANFETASPLPEAGNTYISIHPSDHS